MARPNNETDQTMLTTAGDETDHVSVPHWFGLERDIFSHPAMAESGERAERGKIRLMGRGGTGKW